MRRGLPPSIDEDITGEGRTGIFGWMLLPLLTIFAYPVLLGAILLPTLEQTKSLDFWPSDLGNLLLRRPDEWIAKAITGGSREAQLATFLLALAAFAVVLIFAFRCFGALTRRSLRFPSLMRWYLLLAIPLVWFVLQLPLPTTFATFDAGPFRGALLPLTIVMVVVWLPYFVVSKRVKNTFLKRKLVASDSAIPESDEFVSSPPTTDARAKGFDITDPAPRGIDGFLLVVLAALIFVPLNLARELWTGDTLITRHLPLTRYFAKFFATTFPEWSALATANPYGLASRALEMFSVVCAIGLIVTAILALFALLKHARAFRRLFKWAMLFSIALSIAVISLTFLSSPALLPEQQMAMYISQSVGFLGSVLGLIYLSASRRLRNTVGVRRVRQKVGVKPSQDHVAQREPIHAP